MPDHFGTKENWDVWRANRDQELTDPYGWFSPVELVWLTEEPTSVENFPGMWRAVGNEITADLPEGVVLVRHDHEEITGSISLEVGPGNSDRSLHDDQGREVEAMWRLGKPALRIRDPKSPQLSKGALIDYYSFDPLWTLQGRLLPFAEMREVDVDCAIEGETVTVDSWAEAEVALPDGETVKLLVTGSDPESSHVMFYDETNGDETADWRIAPLVVDAETVVIDFNQATIFPAHMTGFGTCPKAPKENRIPVPVTAGEKKVKYA